MNPDCYIRYREQKYDAYLQDRIDDIRPKALEKLKTVIHPDFAEAIGEIIAWAYREEDSKAYQIAQSLNLSEEELCSLTENQKWLSDIYAI